MVNCVDAEVNRIITTNYHFRGTDLLMAYDNVTLDIHDLPLPAVRPESCPCECNTSLLRTRTAPVGKWVWPSSQVRMSQVVCNKNIGHCKVY